MKTATTDPGSAQKPVASLSIVPQSWDQFSRLYPIYEALTRHCALPGGPYPPGAKPGQWPRARDRDLRWLDDVDHQVQAVDLRHFLVTPAAAREQGLCLLLQRLLCKREKQNADRDKIDLLVVQYFVLCAPSNLIDRPVQFANVAKVLQPVLGEVDVTPPACQKSLDRILDASQTSHSLRDLMEQGLVEQGRLLKESIGEMFYEPAALVAICRFNFLIRRAFIQRVHLDLRAIGEALRELEKRSVKAVDCRRAGLSAAESIARLREFRERWKPPFQSDYTRDSAFRPYEQLMSLREDLEEAVSQSAPSRARDSAPVTTVGSGRKETAKVEAAREIRPPAATPLPAPPAVSAATPPAARPQALAAPAGQRSEPPKTGSTAAPVPPVPTVPEIASLQSDDLEEKIWEQLIETPPARGRSMTTVTVENTRILLSAWEVAAFVSESGPDSDELRRVVVARALLSAAIERGKRARDCQALRQVVTSVRGEVPQVQERIDHLKRSQKTDRAVSLGISLKRLLSLVEESEQLLNGNDARREEA